MIARLVTTLIGIVFFVYGIVAFISPLPVGAPLAVIGLFMIAAANPAFRPVIRSMRRRWRWFDKLVRFVAPRATPAVREVIEETEPKEQDEDGHTDDTEKDADENGSALPEKKADNR